mgnify:CR=1 FL=1
MSRLIDITGQRFGMLTAIRKVGTAHDGQALWLCKCDCGNTHIAKGRDLRSLHVKTCGCSSYKFVGNSHKTHGLSNIPLYGVWLSMRNRCKLPTAKEYKDYGERGITVCDEWDKDFQSFYDWAMANGYKEEKKNGRNILTIDRIDVNGNYEPSNCRFVPESVQARNKRNSLTDKERYTKCLICGKWIEQTRRNGQKTCSRKCAAELSKRNHVRKDYTKICPECGKQFDAQRGGHFKDAIYCSKKCANMAHSPIWTYNGESHHVLEWAKITGVNAHCLFHRKEMGWTVEETLTTPLRGKRHVS